MTGSKKEVPVPFHPALRAVHRRQVRGQVPFRRADQGATPEDEVPQHPAPAGGRRVGFPRRPDRALRRLGGRDARGVLPTWRRRACRSCARPARAASYNAIVLLGGGEPGFMESREIARRYGIPVTSCAFSQMHIASMLGNKFSVIDFTETHNMYYYDLVVRHRFADRCASIRNINFYHARPGHADESTIDRRAREGPEGRTAPRRWNGRSRRRSPRSRRTARR